MKVDQHPQRAEASVASAPTIGQPWPGQGGIYVGLARGENGAPDYHLIMAADQPTADLKWQAAMDWACAVTAEGHTDFRLPTRNESALLYAHLRDQVDTSHWYWTSTPAGGASAWGQHFGYGNQYIFDQSSRGRARAVRRLTA